MDLSDMLKPHDIVVLLKLCEFNSGTRPPYDDLAKALGISRSEINASVKRLQIAKLLGPKDLGELPIRRATEEFLIHGVKYAFPAKHGTFKRGLPTASAAPPLDDIVAKQEDEPIFVWPDPNGRRRGLAIDPLHRSVPDAARKDARLYELLALVDSIRIGRARERKLAEAELIKRLRNDGNES